MAFPSLSSAGPADVANRPPPELNDADYAREVLGCADERTEAALDEALATKAAGLGISLPLPRTPTPREANAFDVDAADAGAGGSQHGRSASTSSNETTASGLTSQTSHRSQVIPATLTETTNVTSRRRSKSLSFSQYEKYLSHVDPTAAAHQPKFLNPAASGRSEWPGSPLIGTSRRKSVRDLKRTIASKLRRRRQISAMTLV